MELAKRDHLKDPAPNTTGFIERSRGVQRIEAMVQRGERGSRVLLVQGMGGAGKTTLLRHVAWWWLQPRSLHRSSEKRSRGWPFACRGKIPMGSSSPIVDTNTYKNNKQSMN
jgi:ABC-type molybdenum transport system ATPase subunit/photorepair protein PhrA